MQLYVTLLTWWCNRSTDVVLMQYSWQYNSNANVILYIPFALSRWLRGLKFCHNFHWALTERMQRTNRTVYIGILACSLSLIWHNLKLIPGYIYIQKIMHSLYFSIRSNCIICVFIITIIGQNFLWLHYFCLQGQREQICIVTGQYHGSVQTGRLQVYTLQ